MASMDLDTVLQDLNRRFAAPLPEFYNRRIIFWYDEDREFEDKLQISLMSVKRLMRALQDNGMIERIGSNRKGYWKITKKDDYSNT